MTRPGTVFPLDGGCDCSFIHYRMQTGNNAASDRGLSTLFARWLLMRTPDGRCCRGARQIRSQVPPFAILERIRCESSGVAGLYTTMLRSVRPSIPNAEYSKASGPSTG